MADCLTNVGKEQTQNNNKKASSVFVEEPIKVADILDSKKNIRYKVVLHESKDKTYDVAVYNMFIDDVPKQIYSQSGIIDFKDADQLYRKSVKDYTFLVKAETIYVEDMSMFDSKVEYQLAKCCMTCIFARWQFDFIENGKRKCKLRCCCPAMFHYSENNLPDPIVHNDKQHDEHCCQHEQFEPDEFFKKNKFMMPYYPGNFENIDLHPIVDPFHVCKFYRLKSEFHPFKTED